METPIDQTSGNQASAQSASAQSMGSNALSNKGSMFQRAIMKLDDKMQECIANCDESALICERVIQHCLSQGGRHAEPTHIKIMQDCAAICRMSADFMLRESAYHASICNACADICEACADSCEKLGDDEMMQICADATRRSAQSCRNMASH